MDTQVCTRCGTDKPLDDYYRATGSPTGHKTICKDCWKLGAKPSGERPTRTTARRSRAVAIENGYVPDPRLLATWEMIRTARLNNDEHPMNLLFLGPSGSGKTHAAEHLAAVAGLPFTKIDAASMTDPESWFGTREIVALDGVAITTYRPSTFVRAIEQPGVLLIDEMNRVRDEHRQILLPLTDGTHRVTNPLTGEVVVKHPECYIIMSGNRGLQFTGTYPVDPAFFTRSLVVTFDYLDADLEIAVAQDRTGCDETIAKLFVRFARETRSRAAANPDVQPISTRQVLYACALAARGGDPDTIAEIVVMNAIDEAGHGAESPRFVYEQIWTGIRPAVNTTTT